MQTEGKNDQDLDTSQSLARLYIIIDQMAKSNQPPDIFLRRYVSIYVQHQSLSEDFFNTLCEHNILLKLFNPPKSQSTIATLQIFNLLLANTTKESDLVYIFSQPILHEYLFEKFKIFKEGPEPIEYYIQLLKTMIMKMSNGKDELLKLFCNGRFPAFPLLTVVTVLGIDNTHEYLVRVTAHQCLLLLINLINEKQTGRAYLTELQMVVFYYQLVCSIVEDLGKEDDGSLRYLVDLIYALQNNPSSLSILMNIVVNVVIVRHLNEGSAILVFLRKLREKIREYQQFPEELSQQLMHILYKITACLFSNDSLNWTYLSTLKIVPALKIRDHPNLLVFYQDRCKRISAYLQNNPDYEPNKDKQQVYEEWMGLSNAKCSLYKNKKNKKRNSFVEFFTTKATTNEEYISDVMAMAGLDYSRCQNPVFKLAWSTNYETALFLVEEVLHTYSDCNPKAIQFEENFVREGLWLNQSSLDVLVQVYRLASKQHQLQKECKPNQKTVKLPGEYNFLCRIKQTLAHYVFNRLLNLDYRPTIPEMSMINKLVVWLNLKECMDQKAADQFLSAMSKLQLQMGQDIFQEDRFRSICLYLMASHEKRSLQELGEKDLQEMKSKKTTNKFLHYQVIKRLMNPSLKTIGHFLDQIWKASFYAKDMDEYRSLMAYKQETGHRIEVFANDKYGFTVNNMDGNNSFLLCEEDGLIEKNGASHKICFKECKDGIKFNSLEKAYSFNSDLKKLNEKRRQTIKSSIFQYLEITYGALLSEFHKGSSAVRTPK